jgi:hypothetical protein
MNHRVVRWACAAAVALLSACYSSANTGDDDAAADGRDVSGDVARDESGGEDAAPHDVPVDMAACTAPQHWRRVTLPIERLEDASDGAVVDGQPVRVAAWVDLGPPGCLELGRISVATDATTRVAAVLVEGWTNEDALAGACPPAEPTMVFAVLPDLTPGTWTIQDGSAGPAGDPVTMTREVIGCGVGCGCPGPAPALGVGEACTWDCECDPLLNCVGYYTRAGTTARACYATCNTDADCRPWEVCSTWDDGPTAVCQLRVERACDPVVGCDPGFLCDCGDGEGILCVCDPVMPVDGGVCCRGEDCAPGQECLQLGGESSVCGVRCVSLFDCPRGSSCAGGGSPLSGICLPDV